MRSEGRTVEIPLQIFGKSGVSPVLMISPSRDGSPEGCVLTGALERLSDFKELEAAFTRQFEAAGKKADDRYFRIGSDMVVLTPTGSRSKPSFRVAVLELGVSK